MSSVSDPHNHDDYNPEFEPATAATTNEFIDIVATLCTEEGATEPVYPDHEVVVRKLFGTERKRLKTVLTKPVFITHNPDEEGNALNLEPMFGLAALHGFKTWERWSFPANQMPGRYAVYQSVFVQPSSRVAKIATKEYFEGLLTNVDPEPTVYVSDATEAEVEAAIGTILGAVPADTKRLTFQREREDHPDSHI